MATTRIIPMHINKGKTIAQCLKARVDYVKNTDKTEGGTLISAYACFPGNRRSGVSACAQRVYGHHRQKNS